MSLAYMNASPAKAGAQLRADHCSGAALSNVNLRDWAPAFAGVVLFVEGAA